MFKRRQAVLLKYCFYNSKEHWPGEIVMIETLLAYFHYPDDHNIVCYDELGEWFIPVRSDEFRFYNSAWKKRK